MITIADPRAHDDPILALTMDGIRTTLPRVDEPLAFRIGTSNRAHVIVSPTRREKTFSVRTR